VLDKYLQAVEGDGAEISHEWRIEVELARGSLDGANTAAKCVHLIL
jgi:hypothetical protein